MGNKHVKKLLSYCLALAMVCSLVVGAAPSEAAATGTKSANISSASDIQKQSDETGTEVEEAEVYRNYFEDGNTKGFVGRGGTIEISNEENHNEGGMNALFVTGRTANWHGVQLPIAKMTEVGSTYKISAWVKQNSGSDANIGMKVQYNDTSGSAHYDAVEPGTDDGKSCPSGEWVEISGSYKIPEYSGELTLYFECAVDTLDFFVDEVVIIGKPVDQGASFNPTDEIMSEMAKDGLRSEGNNARIKKVIEKARAGETVSLAYIGGSVTEGALASPNSKCYAEVSATAFGKKYGKDDGANVHFINAGMSGTPSDIGVVRYSRDVIGRLPEGQDHPDILFIEFAVNDYGCATAGGAYEGLIREALSSGSAVVLIFSVFKPQNRVCEPDYIKYGQKYDLPMVSMGNAINSYYKQEGFDDWYFGDDLHPNNQGYQLMSDCIMNLMDTLDKQDAEPDNITDVNAIEPVKTAAYQGIKMIDQATELGADAAITAIDAGGFNKKDSATGNFQYKYNGQPSAAWFPNNWMHTSASGSDSLKITVNCSTLMLVYKLSNSNQFGSADLYIDGAKKTTLKCYDSSGWNNGKVYLALTGKEAAAVHEIELKMAEGSESKNFTLLAIGYSGIGSGSSAGTSTPTPPAPTATATPPAPTNDPGTNIESPKPTQGPQATQEPNVKKPGTPAIKKLKNVKKKKVTVTLKKKVSGAAGYQVAYATKASMKGQKKKSFTGTSVTVKGLKKKKKYYFRVRAYVKKDGKKVYGSWSKKKKIKIKK